MRFRVCLPAVLFCFFVTSAVNGQAKIIPADTSPMPVAKIIAATEQFMKCLRDGG